MLHMFLRKVRGATRQDAEPTGRGRVCATTGATGTQQDGPTGRENIFIKVLDILA